MRSSRPGFFRLLRMSFRHDFLDLALRLSVLRFGDFTLKSGRQSPYFFNAGLINTGAALSALGRAYARTLVESGIGCDMLFGPAYKGIALASATAIALADEHAHDLPFAFNRKEAKDHGEGGVLIGAPVGGRVLIIDDVISAGTSVRESVRLLQAAGARPCGVLIALDRQERATEGEKDMEWSAVQYVTRSLQLNVAAIATLGDLLQYLKSTEDPALQVFAQPVQRYRDRYGV